MAHTPVQHNKAKEEGVIEEEGATQVWLVWRGLFGVSPSAIAQDVMNESWVMAGEEYLGLYRANLCLASKV